MTESTKQPAQGLEVPVLDENAQTPRTEVPDLAVVPRKELKALLETLLNACETSNQTEQPVDFGPRVLNAAHDFMEAYMVTGLDRELGLNVSGTLAEVLDVQTSPGNYDYNPYMHGMANGLILAQSLILNTSPEFLEAPDVWIADLREAEGDGADPVAHETVLAEQINLSKEGTTTTADVSPLPDEQN